MEETLCVNCGKKVKGDCSFCCDQCEFDYNPNENEE